MQHLNILFVFVLFCALLAAPAFAVRPVRNGGVVGREFSSPAAPGNWTLDLTNATIAVLFNTSSDCRAAYAGLALNGNCDLIVECDAQTSAIFIGNGTMPSYAFQSRNWTLGLPGSWIGWCLYSNHSLCISSSSDYPDQTATLTYPAQDVKDCIRDYTAMNYRGLQVTPECSDKDWPSTSVSIGSSSYGVVYGIDQLSFTGITVVQQ